MRPSTPPRYRAYLLRCWADRAAERADAPGAWRFSLEDPHTGARRGFADLAALTAFLAAALAGEAAAAADGDPAGGADRPLRPPARGP